jgi:hypothetical protein
LTTALVVPGVKLLFGALSLFQIPDEELESTVSMKSSSYPKVGSMTSTKMVLRDLSYGKWGIDVMIAPVVGNLGIGVELS